MKTGAGILARVFGQFPFDSGGWGAFLSGPPDGRDDRGR